MKYFSDKLEQVSNLVSDFHPVWRLLTAKESKRILGSPDSSPAYLQIGHFDVRSTDREAALTPALRTTFAYLPLLVRLQFLLPSLNHDEGEKMLE